MSQAQEGDVIYVQLPKFTIGGGGKKPGPNVPRGELVISPSVYFEGRWIEGEFNNLTHPFPNSTLALYVQEEVTIPAGTSLRVRIAATFRELARAWRMVTGP